MSPIQERRARASVRAIDALRLRGEGFKLHEIAQTLGVSKTTVCFDLSGREPRGKRFKNGMGLDPEKVRVQKSRSKERQRQLVRIAPPYHSKDCKSCRAQKPLQDFQRSRAHADGYESLCKKCEAKYQVELRRRNYHAYWWKILFRQCLQSAKGRSLEISISPEDILALYEKQNGLCYWFGLPIVLTGETKHPQKPSVDRLISTSGYTKDNIVLCCLAANLGRNSASFELFSAFSKLVRGLR